MNIDSIRQSSMETAETLGLPVNRDLPVLDSGFDLRSTEDVTRRLLCLHACAAHAFGLPQSVAVAWLKKQGLIDTLTPREAAFLLEARGDRTAFQSQVEAMWALAWCIGLTDTFVLWQSCPDHFVALMPDVRNPGAPLHLPPDARPPDAGEVLSAFDLAYCLHWGITELRLNQRRVPAKVNALAVVERRKALEWVVYRQNWDDISLDT